MLARFSVFHLVQQTTMKDEIWNLMIKRLSGTETPETKLQLDTWLNEHPDHIGIYAQTEMIWKISTEIPPEENTGSLMRIIKPAQAKPEAVKARLPWLKYGIAAGFTGLLATLTLLWTAKTEKPTQNWITEIATNGKIKVLHLPDGSDVTLNAGSKLQFSDDFAHAEKRWVKLSGEAFFDVKHKDKHPFIVESANIRTTVYGTSFNVRAYANEGQIRVAVKTGKVGVTATNEQNEAIFLLPNDVLNYTRSAQNFTKTKINTAEIENWSKGTLTFEQTPVQEVFETLSRRFNIRFVVDDSVSKNCKLSATFNNRPLADILKTLHTALNITSKQTNETIYVKGGSICNQN